MFNFTHTHTHTKKKEEEKEKKNLSYKVIYSLRIHLYLQEKGFFPLSEMKNPKKPQFNCWVYEASPEFLEVFSAYLEENCEGGV